MVDALLEGTDVRDDAHQTVALGQARQHPDGLFQRVLVQGAEAFIEEEGVQPDAAGRALHLVRKAQRQCQRRLEALAAGEGLDAAAGAVVVVDDAKVQPRLAFLVFGPDPLQLVLARRHLHQPGVGVDEDAVQILHLDVGFQPDLLLAAQGAARRGCQRADPLPALVQLGKLGRVGAVFCQRLAVGHKAGRQGLFRLSQPGALGLQGGKLCFQSGQRALCLVRPGRLLGVQRFQGGFGGRCGVGSSRRFGFQRGPLRCQGLALGFQLGLAAAGGVVGLLGRVQFPLGGPQGVRLLGKGGLQQRDRQGHRAVGGGEALGQQGLGVLPQAGAGLVHPGKGGMGGGTGLLRGAVGFLSGALGGVHLRLGGGGVGQLGRCRVVGAAADGAGHALLQLPGQQSRLRVQKRPFQPIAGGVGLGLPLGGVLVVLL